MSLEGIQRWLRQRLRGHRGFTLVEMMAVLAFIGVASAIGLPLTYAFMDAQARSFQIHARHATAVQTQEHFQTLLASAPRAIGLVTATGQIDPLTVARDQVVFRSEDTNRCHRIFYVQRTHEVRGASGWSCNDEGVTPARGPNERLPDGSWRVVTDTEAANYDPALDSPGASVVLASHISPTPPPGAKPGSPDPLKLFTYWGDNGATVTVDSRADSAAGATHESFYDVASNRTRIAGIALTMYVGQDVDENDHRLQPEFSQQTAWLQRVAPVQGIAVSYRLDGGTEADGTWVSVPASANDQQVMVDATNPLSTSAIPAQSAWIEVRGLVTIKSSGGGGGTPLLRLALFRNGVEVEDANATGPRSTFTWQRPTLGNGEHNHLRFSGAFRMRAVGDDLTDSYQVRVLLSNTDGASYSYTTDRELEYLAYRVELPGQSDN